MSRAQTAAVAAAAAAAAAPAFLATSGVKAVASGHSAQLRGSQTAGSASLSAPAALLGSASALLAAQICGKVGKPRRSMTVVTAFENELGVQAPLGFWDPLGLSKDGDVYSFKRRRSVEIKHGRICMLATMGYITPEIAGKFPGYLDPTIKLKFEDIPNGLAAISKVPLAGWIQMIAYAGFCEISAGYDADVNKRTPGDMGWKPPLFGNNSPEMKQRRLNVEIANGRLSMMAIIGMFFQDGLTGQAWGDWANYTDSPLRAFENELGVQAPLGFWDPLGLSKDGDVYSFKRRRSVEIKHGRICMLATMGYITPEIAGKFPGYLDPTIKLKFEDIPNGLAAISKVPLAGWIQMIAYAGFCEISAGYDADVNKRTPGDMGWKPPLFGNNSPEMKQRRLNVEIANGRLSMMAIIGMFFQDGLTGQAWGDWANYTDSPLRAFENELGVQAPLGFWDPLGLSKDGDVYSFKRRRSVEIKHGRICMLATMGYITPEIAGKFPGYLDPTIKLKFEDIPNGLAAISKVPLAGWIQMIAYAGFCEISAGYDADVNKRTPGDMGWKPPLFGNNSPEMKQRRLNVEIANGRLSMMAIIGMFFQDGLTGQAWGDWANYTDSPLRAFENELGVQAPLGFWDPLGLSKDGDVYSFKRRRSVEIKHGRICMLATMGYITPEIAGKFPGYLDPTIKLKFEDIPNGLAAISKVPLAGWIQMIAYAGFCEISAGYDADVNKRTPGDMGWKPPLFGNNSPEMKQRRLNVEIANGRLAMMAIIGMFFQDGLTGQAWGDWANYTDSPLRAFENELGVQAPLGFWDPLGLSKDGDVYSFKRRRSVEIKHGRICMLATMGYITPEVAGKFPGYLDPTIKLKFEDIPNGLAAISKVPLAGWIQMIAYAGFCEISAGYDADVNKRTPGDMGWKPPLFGNNSPEMKQRRLNVEIANGRLSMMAIIGMFFQDGLTGQAWGDWANYTDSPLRAFENELGVQAPLGFWDPLGLSKDGDVYSFKRRRSVEIKHGRICMLATMGYITPEVAGKFPGYLDPTIKLKFEDIPNGLAAISKVPLAGWIQMIAYAGFCEISAGYDADVNKRTPGDMGWKPPLFGNNAPEMKQRRLNVEIANGRLAMMAIIGMFFQDGLTGQAWGDWANYTDSPLRAKVA
ncbi:unnamed protein product [Effrenium voratum]|uniref:Light-harvesting protein n=1 Tax=Effrenium voratum TaxID=2562239 RepID=A0AA36HWZ1_9DINO|nr:unnamed protein product [Effrenium voratum]CAJ1422554.1 unnamed protein product [Effrenium voratum]